MAFPIDELQFIYTATKNDDPAGARFNVIFGFALFAVIGFILFSRKW